MSSSSGYGGRDIPATISDSSAEKYRFVTGDTTDTTNKLLVCKIATGEATPPLGILQEPVTVADTRQPIRIDGTSKLKVNGNASNIDINTELVATAGGIGVPLSTPDATPQYVGAISLGVSTTDGDVIRVMKVTPYRVVKGTA